MLREQCRVGMIVEFGRENGEKTKGEVVKMNPKMAKVRILEARGRNSEVGAVWNVGYSLMKEAGNTQAVFVPAVEDFPYNPFAPEYEKHIMNAIVDVYNRLSPEWLTADGERGIREVFVLKGNLQNKLDLLFKALGRSVSESAAYKWREQMLEKSMQKV